MGFDDPQNFSKKYFVRKKLGQNKIIFFFVLQKKNKN